MSTSQMAPAPEEVFRFAPTPEHIAIIDEARTFLTKWKPRLPWMAAWHVIFMPIPDNNQEWGMKIDIASFVHGAQLLIKPNPLAAGDKHLFPDGEYTLELLVLHELCHLAIDPLKTHNINVISALDDESIRQAVSVLESEEETVAWNMARALIQVELVAQEHARKLERLGCSFQNCPQRQPLLTLGSNGHARAQ